MNDNQHDWLTKTIREEGRVMFSAHPTAADLVLFAETDTDSPADHHQIAAHLRVCAECADDLNRLQQAGRELATNKREPTATPRGQRRTARTPGLTERFRHWLAPARWIPAVVAVAITVAVLGPNHEAPVIQPTGKAVVLRDDVERGAVPILRPDTAGRVTLSFVLSGTGTERIHRCGVAITGPDGSLVTHLPEITAFDEYGTFVVTINTSDLPTGSYTLTTSDRIGKRSFKFNLR